MQEFNSINRDVLGLWPNFFGFKNAPMTKRKYIRAFIRFLRQVIKLQKALKISAIRWLARVLRVNFQRHQGGFVLPTTVMLLLIVTLVVTAIIFRTFNRTSQVISEREQQVIYNAATPAVDRAKSKLEYLFRQDPRLPAGVVSDGTIETLLNAPASGNDIYTFPGETRLSNFNDSSTPAKPGVGWYFTEDNKTIAYSIIFKKQVTNAAGTTTLAEVKNAAATKAPYLVVRNGPINTSQSTAQNCGGAVQLAANEKDWEPINSATLAKTFQVNAFVVDKASSPGRSVTTLELQQDRQVDKGNKWGAYFRYDLEVAQSPTFRWNGAMHSDANMFFGPYGNPFKSYLISSTSSCVNTSASDSKVTVSSYRDISGTTTFQGQIVAGRLDKSVASNAQQFGGSSTFDLFNGNGNAPTQNQAFGSSDSATHNSNAVDSVNGNATPAQMAVDPVALLTEEVFKSRATDLTNTTYRNTTWKDSSLVLKKRVFNEETTPPYLDDTYRADNLYGPNPTYDGKPISVSAIKIPVANKVGDAITISNAGSNYDALTRNAPPDVKNPEALGLDGYWERRAVTGGLRVVVGQRLELIKNELPTSSVTPTGMGRKHEFLQRRTQKDNLAAVQATAVYHYKTGGGLTPLACLATTVHPGTAETLKRSSTFEKIKYKRRVNTTDPITGVVTTNLIDDTPIFTDFFSGRGTNGWEFSFPSADPDGPVLGKALRNLAYLGGDPYGAFPPRQDSASSQAVTGQTVTHPYPQMTTTFGDFSNLRRALAVPSGSRTIADKSYIDTASCMLGMLAYNMSFVTQYNYNDNWDTTDSTTKLLDDLDEAIKGGGFPGNNTAQVIKMLEDKQNDPTLSAADKAKYVEYVRLAKLVVLKEQTKRDRVSTTGGSACTNSTFVTSSGSSGGGSVNQQNGLQKLCPSGSKYPVLYYLFPLETHNEEADKLDRSSNAYITAVNPDISTPNRYQVVTDDDLQTIATQPKTASTWVTPQTNVTSSVGTGSNLPNNNTTNFNNLIKFVDSTSGTPTTTYYKVAFKDSALFNGREMMSVRVLDVDLNLLRNTDAPAGDKLLPINDNTATNPNAPPPNGIFYAFREDAVREDAIARPVGTAMNAVPGSESDPPLNTVNGMSIKPVDFLPDPDRRPYGFRLKNGSSLNRGDSTAGMSFVSNNSVYIQGDFNLHSTDGTTANLLEEFRGDNNQGKLAEDWGNFYDRSTKDDRFAQPTSDTWRPTEVLGDDINILSNQFCAGSIEDGIIYAGTNPSDSILSKYGCATSARYTSYLNQNRPRVALSGLTPSGTSWDREDSSDSTSPIQISANGKPKYDGGKEYELKTIDGNDSYLKFSQVDPTGCPDNRKCLGIANQTRVNAIIVQSIIPSRAGQSYGGFHTFPRMLENWQDTVKLFMSGAFIQLRFSNQGTGVFDQEAWEPGDATTATAEETKYFKPPTRLWGYDVALQYQTAGPVSRRFVTPGTNRSEVYSELSVEDPYIKKLRCARINANGAYIDPAASCS
ncbi:hormogonium polysaccharide biosynthesis protein HpsA [Nostoc sp. FACHB-888]|uniref:hormogonium polysaccharide biosynthesis protein HpsA n=1 Tax=Nostoc sp. FACHB-888 TaxID=2692842 RepID=UPI0019AB5A88|nr:hormogonium polysaccharide biosynthesis protein HpsA [Nostoc sp. FACHB-888]MBD2242604.1 hypothetical protein [Nostoc sp. FACHB-888]